MVARRTQARNHDFLQPLYLVDATGRNLHRLPFPAAAGSVGQPAFYPLARKILTAATTPGCGGC